ncbi:hypothetical protein [Halalkalibacter flavus]
MDEESSSTKFKMYMLPKQKNNKRNGSPFPSHGKGRMGLLA